MIRIGKGQCRFAIGTLPTVTGLSHSILDFSPASRTVEIREPFQLGGLRALIKGIPCPAQAARGQEEKDDQHPGDFFQVHFTDRLPRALRGRNSAKQAAFSMPSLTPCPVTYVTMYSSIPREWGRKTPSLGTQAANRQGLGLRVAGGE